VHNKLNLIEGHDTIITLLEILICESEIHRNVTSVRTFRASLFSHGKLTLPLQKISQHLNESLKDSRDSEGRDWAQTVKIHNYQPSLPPMLILPGPSLFDDDSMTDRRTDRQCDSCPCGL
jgi:hypothetical protein